MFVCLDLETTGLNPKEDHVIEVAIAKFNADGVTERWSSLVKAPVPVPDFVKNLTGINDEMLVSAPVLEDLKESILDFIGDLPIMGHFIPFDIGFLQNKGFPLNNLDLDTCQLVQVFLPKEPSYSLEVLAQKFGLIHESAHRAGDDVEANVNLFFKICAHLRSLSPEEKAAVSKVLRKSTWGWASFILQSLEERKKESDERLDGPENTDQKTQAHRAFDFKAVLENAKASVLVQEETHTLEDLIDFARSMDQTVTLTTPNVNQLKNTPELGILKHPSQYLDEIRLQRFNEKESFNPIESTLACKLNLWALRTENGEKSEIRLVKEEKDFWYQLSCQESEEAQSYFKKAKELAEKKQIRVIGHRSFLKESLKKDKFFEGTHVLVHETDQLLFELDEAFHLRASERFLRQSIEQFLIWNPEFQEPMDRLILQMGMVFGFMKTFIERQGQAQDPRHAIWIHDRERESSEWMKMKELAEGLKNTLSVINRESFEKHPSLEEIQKSIDFLGRVLTQDEEILWLTQTMDGEPIIHAFLSPAAALLQKELWGHCSKLSLFTHYGSSSLAFVFLKKELGLGDEIEVLEIERNEPIPFLKLEIRPSWPELPGNTFIYSSSKTHLDQVHQELSEDIKKKGVKVFSESLSGGLGKIGHMAKQVEGQMVFMGSEDLLQAVIEDQIPLNTLIIDKIPFLNPKDPIQMLRAKKYRNGFQDYTLPKTAFKIHHLISLFLNAGKAGLGVAITDPRAKQYLDAFDL